MDAWVADNVKDTMLPWAATLVARAWRRHVARRRLLRFVKLRRKIRGMFLSPYLRAWRNRVVVMRRGNFSRKKAAFDAWRGYCSALQQLHEASIRWLTRTTNNMGGLHLTWKLCAPAEGSSSGALVCSLVPSPWHRCKVVLALVWQRQHAGARDPTLAHLLITLSQVCDDAHAVCRLQASACCPQCW